MITENLVKSMTERIVERFSPDKVIVFGSWARGLATRDSDVDFLVVLPYTGSKREAQVSIRRELKQFNVPKDVLVLSPSELTQDGVINGYIYKTALIEGKVMYEKS